MVYEVSLGLRNGRLMLQESLSQNMSRLNGAFELRLRDNFAVHGNRGFDYDDGLVNTVKGIQTRLEIGDEGSSLLGRGTLQRKERLLQVGDVRRNKASGLREQTGIDGYAPRVRLDIHWRCRLQRKDWLRLWRHSEGSVLRTIQENRVDRRSRGGGATVDGNGTLRGGGACRSMGTLAGYWVGVAKLAEWN
jgi:hypothetical protein